jgi:hypothetical protein
MEGAGDRIRHPLDYILVKHGFRNSVKDVETVPGADIDFNLNILVAKICTGLKKIVRFQNKRQE